MVSIRWALLTTTLVVAAACTGGEEEDSEADTGTIDTVASWEDVRPIVTEHCARCHSENRLSTYRRLETHSEVVALRASILDKIGTDPPRGLRMPVASNHVDSEGCVPEHPALNDKRLTDNEIDILTEFLLRTDHRDYVDTFEPIEPPEVPVLADSVTFTSSQLDVVNDGFITPPDGVSDDYMHEHGYDERDYDQMEDDWFCIEFDPMRSQAGFLTGVQVGTEIGQIYLNSQLVIDTRGGFDEARAAASERGDDWYRCDPGLGFDGAIPLWRTVPGGQPIELPEGTGLRFEPGWTFVLRVDFHTHFDAEEFMRLDQNGVIDREAGTMTWFDRAFMRAQWASPSEISRPLQWLTIGPRTAAERTAFEVPPGASELTFSATLPEDGDYTVFSAEVGMGYNGKVASVVETSTSTCVANNSDFSPKWIEQAIYAEDDAPQLDGDSVLELTCSYRNGESESILWGDESQATQWGRKERCSAVVFYY